MQEEPCLGLQEKRQLVNLLRAQGAPVVQPAGGEEAGHVLKAPVVLEDVWAPMLRGAGEAAFGGPRRGIRQGARVRMYAAHGHRMRHP